MKCSVCVLRSLVGVLVLSTFGCGGGSGLPEGETGTVTGTVTYNNAPVPEGTVIVFMMDGGGHMATDSTDAAGKYELLMRDAPQVLSGSYSVGVTPPLPDMGLSDDEIMERSAAGTLPESPKSVIPERYLSAETSGLSFEVKAGENTIDISVVD
jgi:hypothetical protein